MGGRFCDFTSDLCSFVLLKFLFGFVNQRFSFSLVCSFFRSQPCWFSYPRQVHLDFYSHGQLTQTWPPLVIKTAAI